MPQCVLNFERQIILTTIRMHVWCMYVCMYHTIRQPVAILLLFSSWPFVREAMHNAQWWYTRARCHLHPAPCVGEGWRARKKKKKKKLMRLFQAIHRAEEAEHRHARFQKTFANSSSWFIKITWDLITWLLPLPLHWIAIQFFRHDGTHHPVLPLSITLSWGQIRYGVILTICKLKKTIIVVV